MGRINYKKLIIAIIGIIGIAVVIYFGLRILVNNYYLLPKEVQQAQQETNKLQGEAQKLLDSKDLDK